MSQFISAWEAEINYDMGFATKTEINYTHHQSCSFLTDPIAVLHSSLSLADF